MVNVNEYFSTARERYQIRLRRLAGAAPPFTEDKVFQQWRFCNVHREHDRTTEWFRVHVRTPASKVSFLRVVEATVAFRWFNRIETGERIVDLLVDGWNSDEAAVRLGGMQPVVTGAYIIKGWDGYNKLGGVLKCIDEALPQLPAMIEEWNTLQRAWSDLQAFQYMGRFMAYEVVSDLRWTQYLSTAPDINTWANAGPGCARGLSWVVYGESGKFNPGSQSDQKAMLEVMQELLALSRDHDRNLWHANGWHPWEMREVEHWACEYDKYCRAKRGDRMKRKFTCT